MERPAAVAAICGAHRIWFFLSAALADQDWSRCWPSTNVVGGETRSNEEGNMADCVFTETIALPDRMIEDGYVLVGDGKVQAVEPARHCRREARRFGFLVLRNAIDAQVPQPAWAGRFHVVDAERRRRRRARMMRTPIPDR